MSKEDKIVVYTATRNYYPHLLPAVTSLLHNSSVDKVYFIIEDHLFPYKLPDKIITVNACRQIIFPPNGANSNSRWTYMNLLKMAIPRIFRLKNKVLYLDVDTIIDKNIDDLWDYSIDNYYFGAVKEVHKSTPEKSYFNSGVLLMNCAKLRQDKMCDTIINTLNKRKYAFPDQDCMNELCSGKILELPGDYNVTWFNTKPTEEKIIHYAAVDKWDQTELYQKYLKIYEEDFCKI